MKILLSSETERAIDSFIAKPAHALLIIGASGSGKTHLAQHMAVRLLGVEKLGSYPYFRFIQPEKGSISIDNVRAVQEFVRLKTLGDRPVRRLLIIERADTMTTEAQNALLKILEEPPEDTVIILTSPPEGALLPTIVSRTTRLAISMPSKTAVIEHFEGHSAADLERAYSLSGGHIGLMTALLDPASDHPLNAAVALAKQLLASDRFGRLAIVDKLAKQKDELPNLITALLRIYKVVLDQAVKAGRPEQIRKAHAALQRLIKAETNLKFSPNAKLLLSDLFLNI